MKQYFILITLLFCKNTQVIASFPPEITHIEITERHLNRITFQRGLGAFIFNARNEKEADIFKNNVIRSVTKATKKLFEVLIKEASTDTIAPCLRSGADANAQITFKYQGTTVVVTPGLIVAALEHSTSTEIFQAFKLADFQITENIGQIASNEPEIGDLFQKIMTQTPQAHGTSLPLTPPESPQEAKALFKAKDCLTQEELQIFLLSLRIQTL